MLHITNGDAAAENMRAAAIAGTVLPWRDVLHEGPVPCGLSLEELSDVRAKFIASLGWGSEEQVRSEFARRDAELAAFDQHEEVILWFEHDLYDQLQLLQLLTWFAGRDLGRTQLRLVNPAEYLGEAAHGTLRELFDARRNVTSSQLRLGQEAWSAFCADSPESFERLLAGDLSPLPFLRDAITRLLQQYPSTVNGLARSEAQALDAIAKGKQRLADAFMASHHEQESPIWLGDTTFAHYIERMSSTRVPLVVDQRGGVIEAPKPEESSDFWDQRAELTEEGWDVRAGRADAVRLNGIDRWLGGVHLQGGEAQWRWDPWIRRIKRADAPTAV